MKELLQFILISAGLLVSSVLPISWLEMEIGSRQSKILGVNERQIGFVTVRYHEGKIESIKLN